MKNKSWLLAGAACGALVLSAPAEAATRHRTPRGPTAAESQAAEIKALRDQVQALTDRLNAQEAAQKQTQAQAAQAQATAQAVQEAQASAADDIENIPAQVNLAVAAIPKPKKSWAEDTVVSGRMYYDLTTLQNKSNGVKVVPTGTGFDIKRFYVGVDHKFNDVFSANITTDFQYASAISSTEVYIKKAYLQAKINDALVVRLGSTDLPWVPYAEDIYGY
ncbi:MAG TPA: porin, partial [Phenylobacterium sp.]|nr:porin [Phenylobacterium sp.]